MATYQAVVSVMRPDGIVPFGYLLKLEPAERSTETLITVGAITRVDDVLLRDIPGWGERAKAVAEVGIYTVGDFFAAKLDVDAVTLKISEKDLQGWQEELLRGWPVGTVPLCNC